MQLYPGYLHIISVGMGFFIYNVMFKNNMCSKLKVGRA